MRLPSAACEGSHRLPGASSVSFVQPRSVSSPSQPRPRRESTRSRAKGPNSGTAPADLRPPGGLSSYDSAAPRPRAARRPGRLQLFFGRALIPAVALGAEGHIAALAVSPEAQGEAAPALPLAHLDFAFGLTGHRLPPALRRPGGRATRGPAGLASRLRWLARRPVGGVTAPPEAAFEDYEAF
jgi:hypothetical protein